MENDKYRTRRRLLRVGGLTAVTGVLAGCLDGSTTDDPGSSTNDSDGDKTGTGDDTDGENGSAADGSDGDSASDGDGSDGDSASDGSADADDSDSDTNAEDGETEPTDTNRKFEIEPGAEVLFSGETVEWVGLEPSRIEGISNPTLVLEAGEEYTIGWTENNGSMHNIEIWNDDEEVVNGLETELVTDPGEEQKMTVTASEEMTLYVCHPHNNAGMRGSIEVRTGE
ncbi:hypothetical protein CP556_07845 [Natrinema sp. CBA1119]|uniref:plastocyanin/azurin family copper-binding protein n=1 Tax=Natrinema sp. CBA1119 TaxID=1608465 RepID=UPI000BF59245|nr:plastocyanin/azurin family copper-binding protein [Natrinema sp. CBA1119]PGF16038.1 hypothetical protein CP556_07845 [Natrinema sp. CBA1119]